MIEGLFRKCAVGAVWALWYTGMWFSWRGAWLAIDKDSPAWLVDPSWYSFMLASTAVAALLYTLARFLSK